jgi:phospholipase/carboxylesterase
MRFPSRCFGLLLALLSTVVGAQSLWVEAKVLTPLRVELPTPYDPARAYPLVLLLHGRGGAAAPMVALRAQLGGDRFIIAAPQGPYPEGGGYRWFLPSDDPKLWAHSDPLVVDLIQQVIQALRQRHAVAGVYLLGHSEGAGLAYLATARLRSEVAGVLAFGAGPPGSVLGEADIAALKGVPHFLAHGQSDSIFPYASLPARLDYWKAMQVPATFVGYVGGHSLEHAPLAAAGAWILKQESTRSVVVAVPRAISIRD